MAPGQRGSDSGVFREDDFLATREGALQAADGFVLQHRSERKTRDTAPLRAHLTQSQRRRLLCSGQRTPSRGQALLTEGTEAPSTLAGNCVVAS